MTMTITMTMTTRTTATTKMMILEMKKNMIAVVKRKEGNIKKRRRKDHGNNRVGIIKRILIPTIDMIMIMRMLMLMLMMIVSNKVGRNERNDQRKRMVGKVVVITSIEMKEGERITHTVTVVVISIITIVVVVVHLHPPPPHPPHAPPPPPQTITVPRPKNRINFDNHHLYQLYP